MYSIDSITTKIFMQTNLNSEKAVGGSHTYTYLYSCFLFCSYGEIKSTFDFGLGPYQNESLKWV